MKIKVLIVILFVSITFSNCRKDKQDPPQTLTSKIWKRGLTDINPSTNPHGKVIYYAVKNCEKDDTFKFGTNGKLILNRNEDKCDPDKSQIASKSYVIDRAAKKLVINGTEYTLAEVSKNQIKYYSAIPAGTGYEYLIFLLQ